MSAFGILLHEPYGWAAEGENCANCSRCLCGLCFRAAKRDALHMTYPPVLRPIGDNRPHKASDLFMLPRQKKNPAPSGVLFTLRKADQPTKLSSTPAATAEPMTPATLGPMACMSRKLCGLASRPTLFDTRAAIGTAETPAEPISGLI